MYGVHLFCCSSFTVSHGTALAPHKGRPGKGCAFCVFLSSSAFERYLATWMEKEFFCWWEQHHWDKPCLGDVCAMLPKGLKAQRNIKRWHALEYLPVPKNPSTVRNPGFSVVLYCHELQWMTPREWHLYFPGHCHTLGVHLCILVVFATPERTTNHLTTPVLMKESTALCKMSKNCWLPLPVLLRWNWQTSILLMRVQSNENACPLLVGLSVSAAIVEKLMEVSSNSSVLCISARSEMIMSKRHPHTPVPLLKVLHTVREECWQFYTVCGQGYSANWA